MKIWNYNSDIIVPWWCETVLLAVLVVMVIWNYDSDVSLWWWWLRWRMLAVVVVVMVIWNCGDVSCDGGDGGDNELNIKVMLVYGGGDWEGDAC
jgi:hypothetical protein